MVQLRPVAVVMALMLVCGCCCPPRGRTCCPPATASGVVQLGPWVPAPPRPDLEVDEATQAAPADAGPTTTDLRVMLSKKRVKGLEWEDANLDVALTYLRTITGVAFTVSPKAREALGESHAITLHLDDVAVDTVLDLVTSALGLRWQARDDGVQILGLDEIGGVTKLRYYDIKDLEVPADRGAALRVSDPDVVAALKKAVHPEFWAQDGAVIETRNGVLIVSASPAVHDAIDAWLSDRRLVRLPPELRKKFEAVRVSLSIKDSTVNDVIKILTVQTGLNLMIDPRASDLGKKRVVAWEFEDAPLVRILRLIAEVAQGDVPVVWGGQGTVAMLTSATPGN